MTQAEQISLPVVATQFDIVRSTRDGAAVFAMSPEIGGFIIGAVEGVDHQQPGLVVRKGYGELALPDTGPWDEFSTIRLAKGRLVYNALERLRTSETADVQTRKIAAIIQHIMADTATTIANAEPRIAQITDESRDPMPGRQSFTPEEPSSFWRRRSIETFLHSNPIVIPTLLGNVNPNFAIREPRR